MNKVIKIKKIIRRVYISTKEAFRRNIPSTFYRIFCFLPINSKLAVFESYRGESFSGNPKYIQKELSRRDSSFKCIAFVRNPELYSDLNDEVFYIKRLSIKYIYYLSRAKYVVNNVNYPDFLKKREGTYHVQTMHGTPLKLMGADLIDNPEYAYKQNLLGLFSRSKRWDLLVSPNNYTTKIFKRVFRYEGEVLECGYPRNDILVNGVKDKSQRLEIRNKLGIDNDKKVILFAPTWRESSSPSDIRESLNLDFEKLQQLLSKDSVIILRLHHLVSSNLDVSRYKGFIYDFSDYPDSQELLVASDMLISDYSSIMFDYLNYQKPVVLYLHDYDSYLKDRGVYFDIRTSGVGRVSYTFEELVDNLASHDFEFDAQQSVVTEFCHAESGVASGTVVTRMLEN
ncbi:putative Teichoic acid poly(glycerol phosphate) polymerase [Vibrio chagasii]|uniref:CDP-glycerol glycerophosphotransferase family protein n=1 Tax=Vibrio chagasii TaxID=170679 RepID=UPI00338A8F94|nr:putative Teichoic acid poly(glycerol phosphate) polymerase [Vibrio chagasii]CAH7126811.1 putative Teichoic acid poly(glycerol phosphate) polymerase [Vibrio chagasii]